MIVELSIFLKALSSAAVVVICQSHDLMIMKSKHLESVWYVSDEHSM